MSNPVQQLIACQDRLYAFVLALLGDPVAAEDVLQETNLAATERLEEATKIADFTAWIFGVARHQVQEHRRRQARERILFGDDLIELFAGELAAAASDLSPRQQALAKPTVRTKPASPAVPSPAVTQPSAATPVPERNTRRR